MPLLLLKMGGLINNHETNGRTGAVAGPVRPNAERY
jgi:hypothetical protein